MAAGLEEGSVLDTVEVDDELEEIAASFFCRSPHGHKIRHHVGSALDIAPTLGCTFDLVFIDGDIDRCPRSAKSRTSGIWTTSAQGSNSRSTASKSPGSLYKSFTRTWADVYESLDRSEFGRYADIRNPFKDEVAAIVARNADDERRQLHEILKFVQSRIAWDGTYRLTPESSPHAAVDKRRGDSGSINFILAAAPARRRIQTGNHPAQSPAPQDGFR